MPTRRAVLLGLAAAVGGAPPTSASVTPRPSPDGHGFGQTPFGRGAYGDPTPTRDHD